MKTLGPAQADIVRGTTSSQKHARECPSAICGSPFFTVSEFRRALVIRPQTLRLTQISRQHPKGVIQDRSKPEAFEKGESYVRTPPSLKGQGVTTTPMAEAERRTVLSSFSASRTRGAGGTIPPAAS